VTYLNDGPLRGPPRTTRQYSVGQQCNWTATAALSQQVTSSDWIGLCSVLRPHQHSIGYTGDGFYRSKDPTNSIKIRTYIDNNAHTKRYTQNNTASPLV